MARKQTPIIFVSFSFSMDLKTLVCCALNQDTQTGIPDESFTSTLSPGTRL